jgi:hypothetical protein
MVLLIQSVGCGFEAVRFRGENLRKALCIFWLKHSTVAAISGPSMKIGRTSALSIACNKVAYCALAEQVPLKSRHLSQALRRTGS